MMSNIQFARIKCRSYGIVRVCSMKQVWIQRSSNSQQRHKILDKSQAFCTQKHELTRLTYQNDWSIELSSSQIELFTAQVRTDPDWIIFSKYISNGVASTSTVSEKANMSLFAAGFSERQKCPQDDNRIDEDRPICDMLTGTRWRFQFRHGNGSSDKWYHSLTAKAKRERPKVIVQMTCIFNRTLRIELVQFWEDLGIICDGSSRWERWDNKNDCQWQSHLQEWGSCSKLNPWSCNALKELSLTAARAINL
jgi:hypothetical protein